MPTPYDNHDPGFTREERRIAAQFAVDLDAQDFSRTACESRIAGTCATHGVYYSTRPASDCPTCTVLKFLTVPTLAGCLSLMVVR